MNKHLHLADEQGYEWTCADCAIAAGGRIGDGLSTMHEGTCPVRLRDLPRADREFVKALSSGARAGFGRLGQGGIFEHMKRRPPADG